MIEVKNLSKQFKVPTEKKGLFGPKKKNFLAVDSLDFTLKKGKVLSTTIDRYIYVVVKKQLGIVEYKYRINWSEVEFKNSE